MNGSFLFGYKISDVHIKSLIELLKRSESDVILLLCLIFDIWIISYFDRKPMYRIRHHKYIYIIYHIIYGLGIRIKDV